MMAALRQQDRNFDSLKKILILLCALALYCIYFSPSLSFHDICIVTLIVLTGTKCVLSPILKQLHLQRRNH